MLQASRSRDQAQLQHGSSARRISVRIAHRLGGRNRIALGAWLGLGPRSVRHILAQLPSADELKVEQAAVLILSSWARFVVNSPESGKK
ncbi:MAG: hypothetical protein ACXWPM_11820 [Bdellovibrionota bacterium]